MRVQVHEQMANQGKSSDQSPRHDMQCVEIWGGNRAIDSSISTAGIDAWVYSEPHLGASVGGDIHYVSMCSRGWVTRFVVADVAGHGETVSALASTLRRLMQEHVNRADQTEFARVLNREFGRLAEIGQFATAMLISYDAQSEQLVLCNAGHPRPLIRRAGEADWKLLDHTSARDPGIWAGASGLPLGVIEQTDYLQFAMPFSPGDQVLVYTDAVIEACGDDGRRVGEVGLPALLECNQRIPTSAIIHELLRRLSVVRGGVVPQDDVTLLLLEHNGVRPDESERGALR